MILQEIKQDYGFATYREVKNLININKLLRTAHHKKNFLKACKNEKVFSKKVIGCTKGIINLQFYSKSCKRVCENIHEELKVKVLNLFIKDIYNHINYLKRKLENSRNRLHSLLPLEKLQSILENQQKTNINIYMRNKTEILHRVSIIKCNTEEKRLITLNKHNNSNSDPWLVNLSNIEIPKNVHALLRLGDKGGGPILAIFGPRAT